jgi:hypothetical protein
LEDEGGNRVGGIRVNALTHSKEPDTIPLEGVHLLVEVEDGTGEAIQFPHNHCVEIPLLGGSHEAVEGGAGGFGTGHTGVHILVREGPTSTGTVVPQFFQLDFTVLIVGGNAGVQNYLHVD